ncbi:transcriptional regulator of RNA polII, SAGA, subunit-domain-containing protein [Fimicolochytrium jonesii]|uniref:transcriptional regulator of RNA polII, SAGA, subunit-domain-containing protein n=1 Tax=Fimicolochytrium jonesii TaxID=1396493 RepID=UPI0022FDDCF2|nr:transcriptional regulator of RNA polII, SAGA, subunit-domain-containing protein [Fimicolochytrium jonesii]KAI8816305.1 transcriptional regulator of RNA polII, SAGA, subunit-domain-containing protein [Fimicolochytrium jonesii]
MIGTPRSSQMAPAQVAEVHINGHQDLKIDTAVNPEKATQRIEDMEQPQQNGKEEETKPKRIDTIALKKQLAVALGERGDEYWTKLKDFVAGKCNRAEFDVVAREILNKHKVLLHNRLIMAILFNVYRATPIPTDVHPHKEFYVPPDPSTVKLKRESAVQLPKYASAPDPDAWPEYWVTRKRKAADDMTIPDWKTKVRRREVMSFGISERQRIKNLVPKNTNMISDPKTVPLPTRYPKEVELPLHETIPNPAAIPSEPSQFPPLCQDQGSLPTFDNLRELMTLGAKIEGLAEGIESDDCVKLIDGALRTFIMNQLSTILRTTLSSPSSSSASSTSPKGESSTSSVNAAPLLPADDDRPPTYIPLSHVLFTSRLRPSVFARSIPLLEEATAMMDEFEGTIEEKVGDISRAAHGEWVAP